MLAFLLAAGCQQVGPAPRKILILKGDQAVALLRQCSRNAPLTGEASWQPHQAHIANFEQVVFGYLRKKPSAQHLDLETVERDYYRQYAGIVRDGKRYLYASFFPDDGFINDAQFKDQFFWFCDAGHQHFGVELDIDRNVVTHLAFDMSLS